MQELNANELNQISGGLNDEIVDGDGHGNHNLFEGILHVLTFGLY